MNTSKGAVTARDLYRAEQTAERINEQLKTQLLRRAEGKRLAR